MNTPIPEPKHARLVEVARANPTLTVAELRERFGLSKAVIQKALERAGVQLRPVRLTERRAWR